MEPLAPDRSGVGTDKRLAAASADTARHAGIADNRDTGVSFFARVSGAEGSGKWLLTAENGASDGKRGRFSFTVSDAQRLRPGALVRVLAERGESGKTTYRIIEPGAQPRAEALRSLGLVPDRVALHLVAVTRALGLHVEPQRIRRLQALVERAVRGGGVQAEDAAIVAAAADDKGLPLTPESIRAIAQAAHPRSGFNGGGGHKRENRRAQPVDAAAVRGAVTDFQSQPSALSLMNSALGRSGKRWLVFPLGFSQGSVEIEASLRILLDTAVSDLSRSVEYCIIDISTKSRYVSIEVVGCCGEGKASVRCEPPIGSERVREAFRGALRPLGVEVVFPSGPFDRCLMDPEALDPPSVREDA